MRKLITGAAIGALVLGLGACHGDEHGQDQQTVNRNAATQQQQAVQEARLTASQLRGLVKQAGATLKDPSAEDVSRDVDGDLSILAIFPHTDGEDIRIYENGDGSNVPTCSNPNHIHTWDLLGDGWNVVIDGGHGIDNFPVKR